MLLRSPTIWLIPILGLTKITVSKLQSCKEKHFMIISFTLKLNPYPSQHLHERWWRNISPRNWATQKLWSSSTVSLVKL